MNVCHVITRMIIGGAQENTLLTCQGLHARGHQVTLVTGPDTGPEGSLLAEAEDSGFKVVVEPLLRRAIRPLSDFRARRRLRRLFGELKPDVVHTHSSKAGIVGRYAARDSGVPIVVHTIHGMSFNRTQPAVVQWLYRRLEARCAGFTDRIVSVADAMTRQSVAAGVASADKFVTIYSGMRTEWYDPARHDRRAIRRAWGVTEDQVVIGTVARLFENKGYEQLIPAMAEAVRRVPSLRFVWVGNGARRAEYERKLDQMGIRSRVRLAGLVTPQQVAPALAGMDVLVHASQWEGLPRAAVQALLMQKPVISFNIDGAPEVVLRDSTGLVVPFNSIPALADAMVTLAEDKDLRERMGRNGRELCLRRFDHSIMVEAIERLYSELADRRKERQSAS